jgi:hypothetical protein
VYRIGIALLKDLEISFLEMDMVELSKYFRDNVRKQKLHIQDLLTIAENIYVDDHDLEKLRDKFYIN